MSPKRWPPGPHGLVDSALPFRFRQPISTVSFASLDLRAICSWTANWSRRFWGKQIGDSSTLKSRKAVIASSSCNMPAQGKMLRLGCGGRIRQIRILMGIIRKAGWPLAIFLHIGLMSRWNPWRMRQAGRWRGAVRKHRGPRSVGTTAAISGPCIPGMISTGFA